MKTLLEKITKNNPKRLQILEANKETGIPFGKWYDFLDLAFWAEFGVSLKDLPDLCLVGDMYEDGQTIFEALQSCVDTHVGDCSTFANVVSLHPNWKDDYHV